MTDPGFEIVEGVLSPGECDTFLRELSPHLPRRSRAGARHLMRYPGVRDGAFRETLLGLARRRLGPGATPYRATLFEKSGLQNWGVVWHQDTALPLESRAESPEWGPWSVKEGVLYAHAPSWALARIVALRVHLDASTSGNGPLKVLPGSHAEGVLSDEQVFRRARERPPVECLVGRGGVLVMSPLLIHASSRAVRPEPRRVLHVEYAASLDVGAGLRLAVA
jgi:hypothetical protein